MKELKNNFIIDELLELRGCYATSFYSIYLNGTYNPDILQMTQKDQGTLLHEYIHFIQNVSTVWGMYFSMYIYNVMYQTLHVLTVQHEITIPIDIALSAQTNVTSNILNLTFGTRKLNNRSARIDWSVPVKLEIKDVECEGKHFEIPVMTVTLDNGAKENVEIGGLIVMETMSALYQSLIDPSATHPDVPYNIIVKYCQQHYPKLAADTRKLICLCYASLFTFVPGTQLIDLIKQHGNNELNGYEAFQQFVENYPVKAKGGQPSSLVEFVDGMIDGFKKRLGLMLHSKLDYLEHIFEPLKLSSQWVPVVTALYDEKPFCIDHFKKMIEQIGMPYLYTSNHQYSFPNGIKKEDASSDLIELLGLQTIYRYFRTPSGIECECQLAYMCQGGLYKEDRCKNKPWSSEVQCPFSEVASWFDLGKKSIKLK